jgi:predicted ABC-class ATPase
MSLLAQAAMRLDGRPYPAYRDLAARTWPIADATLTVEHVQPDPFAGPSRLRVDLAPDAAALPLAPRDADGRRAVADFLHRALARRLDGESLAVTVPGAEVLERTAVTVRPDGGVVLRLTADLPAVRRRIQGRAAATLLAETLPAAVEDAIVRVDAVALAAHVAAVEDQVALRADLAAHGLVAFLADGAILPRRSGVATTPLPDAVPLVAPDALAVTLVAPHAGPLRGLGIPAGVTVVCGGGYHGKSTLLDAVARGVYDHPPGDGRERCVTVASAVHVRAEDGRAVRAVDLRPFIRTLPLGRSTARFDTDDASGSTSQAAAIVEALEAGARALLVDEDTAASNFMVRDARMRRLIPGDDEPITPFVDRVRQLWDAHGVSSVLVVGGAGDWLDVADTVVRMADYRPLDAAPLSPARRGPGRARGRGRDAPRRRGAAATRPVARGGAAHSRSGLARSRPPRAGAPDAHHRVRRRRDRRLAAGPAGRAGAGALRGRRAARAGARARRRPSRRGRAARRARRPRSGRRRRADVRRPRAGAALRGGRGAEPLARAALPP